MIQIRNKAQAAVPDILSTAGAEKRTKLEEAFDAGEISCAFDNDIYGHAEVKEALKDLQAGKCCFCEAKITHISHGDVEHFRPKAGWVQDKEKLNRPGYYWLAYDWQNLLLCCEICNRRHKRNLFPLLNADSRAGSHHQDIKNENPVFIHPVLDDPGLFIAFKEEIPVAINGNERGRKTIEQLGLDREELNEHRREKLNPIKELYGLAKDLPPSDPDSRDRAKDIILRYRQKAEQDGTEYASMLRCFFRNNPVDF